MADIVKVQVDELSLKDKVLGSDLLVVTDGTNTYNTNIEQVKTYMRNNLDFTDEFIEKETIGAANGIAPLNASKKIDGKYITYGTANNTVYQGSAGHNLEQNLSEHISSTGAHGLGNVDNTSDMDKPVSTAQQTALNKKANISSPTLTGTPKAPTATAGTNTTQIATTAFVQTAINNAISASDAMIIKGTIGTNGTVTALPTTYKIGWTYRVVSTGIYAGQKCEIGDLIIALVDRNGTGNLDSDWCVAQTNINGAITNIKSSDGFITINQSGSVISLAHADATKNNTTSTTSPSHGGTITAIKSITSDAKGHITGVETETITLPKDNNTDQKATQTNTTTDADYRVVLSTNANDTTETNTLRKSTNFTANPNTGAFYAKGYNKIDITGETLDINDCNLSNGSPEAMMYICKLDGGATNISNIPITGKPFILYVELIRYNTSTDYVTTQRFVSRNDLYHEYFRYCLNGNWSSWVKRVFTDTNTHYVSSNVIGATDAITNTTAELSNGNVYLNSVENGKVTSSHKISGSGGTVVTTDVNGNIVINSPDISENGEIVVDDVMSDTSMNPVQNKAISAEFQKYLPLNGGTLEGNLVIKGEAASKPLTIRGIVGSDGNGNVGDLYLQYGANAKIMLGGTGKYNISADGSKYSGNANSATKLETSRIINGMSFNGSQNIINYGTCSTSAATVEKTVACSGFSLVIGAEITVKFTVANTASSPTLNVNGTGAKPIYYRGAVIVAGALGKNKTFTFRYNGTQYELVGDLDSNTYDRIKYSVVIKCGTDAISAYNIIVSKNGLYQHLKSGEPFDISYPILYASSSIAASATGNNNYLSAPITITTTQNITLTVHKPVYIKGTLSGKMFTPISTTPLTQAEPTTSDGYVYILLGIAYTTTGIYLLPSHPIYKFAHGVFGETSNSNSCVEIISDAEPTNQDVGDYWLIEY